MNKFSKEKPWGTSTTFIQNERGTVKLLLVKKGEELSLQFHHHRQEFWKVMMGNPVLTIGNEVIEAHPDGEFNVPQEVNHRISAPHDEVLILEISTGEFDEQDIVRIEDKYGR